MKTLTWFIWGLSGISFLALLVATVVYVIMGAPDLGRSWPYILQSWVAIGSMIGMSITVWWFMRSSPR